MSSENINTNYKKRPALLCITTTVLAKVSLHLEVHFKWSQGHGKKWYAVWWGRKKYSFTGEVGQTETFQLRYCKIEQKRLFCTLSCWETVQVWFETFFLQIWKTNIPSGEDYSQKKLVGVCGPFPKTLTIFMIRPEIKYPVYDRSGWHRWRGLVHGFIDNNEKVASSKQHTQ